MKGRKDLFVLTGFRKRYLGQSKRKMRNGNQYPDSEKRLHKTVPRLFSPPVALPTEAENGSGMGMLIGETRH